MKKFLSVLLSVSLLVSACTMLTSCFHQCEFSAEWSKDENSHWHTCVNEKCEEIADKADHTWDNGVITTTATQEEDGVKTFTCTVCQHTKTEPVEFTGLSKKEWDATLDYSVFENVSYKESSTVKYSGVTIESETEYKIKKTMAYAKITIAGQSEQEYTSNLTEINTLRTSLVDSIKSIAKFAKFEYDAETKTYKATEAITIAALGASTSDITITFADGKLAEIKYTASFTQSGIDFYVTSTVTLYDYGTTVVAGTPI